MKKVLGLLFISASIFSMQLDTVGINCERAKRLNYQLAKHSRSKLDMSRNAIKQCSPKLNINIKDCIQPSHFSAPVGLGDVKLFHNENGFHVEHKGKINRIEPCFTDKTVRKVPTLDIKDFLKEGKGYFAINQMGDGKFELKVLDRKLGGGPGLGFFAYCATKVVCYGVITAAAITTICCGGAFTIGKISPSSRDRTMGALRQMSNDNLETAVRGGLLVVAANSTVPMMTLKAAPVIAKGVVVATSSAPFATTALTTASGAIGAKMVGSAALGISALGVQNVSSAIIGAGLAEEAVALTVAGGMSTAGTGLGIAASIELLALKVGFFFGMMPTP